MMRIAVDCRMIRMSGIGVYLDNILKYWIINCRYEFLLLGRISDLIEYEKYDNCQIFECEISIFSLKELLLFPTIEVNKCSVFYTPNFNIPFGVKVPIYSTIHDVVSLDIETNTGYIGRVIRKMYMYRATRISRRIFTVSEFSKKRILHYFPKIQNLAVVYNGISYNVKKFKLEDKIDETYFIYVGNVKKHKGIDVLIQAMEKYVLIYPTVKLYIVGKFEDFKTSDSDVMKVKNINIFFTGVVDNLTLYKYISCAKALIQPSRYEGFGIPPLEALYLGTPVIISDIEVFKEIYKKLPVVFFESENHIDLFTKMNFITNVQRLNCKEIINKKYNYQFTAQNILKYIILDNE